MPTSSELARRLLDEGGPVRGFYPHLNPKVPGKADTLNTPEHRGALAKGLLEVLPGSGEAMSARDAWDASGRAGEALLAGRFGDAASGYGDMALGALGAIPGAGYIARGTKRGAAWMDRNVPEWANRLLDAVGPKDAGRTLFSGAGPTDDDWRYVRRTKGDNPDTGVGYMMFRDGASDPDAAFDSLRRFGAHQWQGRPVNPVMSADIEADIERYLLDNPNIAADYTNAGEHSIEEAAQLMGQLASPSNIVDSAGLWDDPAMVEKVWEQILEPRGAATVITPDGMILFDPSGVRPYKP
jgi:hypothetical protein